MKLAVGSGPLLTVSRTLCQALCWERRRQPHGNCPPPPRGRGAPGRAPEKNNVRARPPPREARPRGVQEGNPRDDNTSAERKGEEEHTKPTGKPAPGGEVRTAHGEPSRLETQGPGGHDMRLLPKEQ